MAKQPANRFNWRLPIYGVLGAVIALLPQLLFGNDPGPLLASLVVTGIVGLALLVLFFLRVRHQPLAALTMFVIFPIFSWFLFRTSNNLRTSSRWLIHSTEYKARLNVQPDPKAGQLKHIEWDAWGFAGSATFVYLVFDPSDSLNAATQKADPGKPDGIPCKVAGVHRLESHWYTVLFFTDTGWDYCT
jgi:hypothetical protein